MGNKQTQARSHSPPASPPLLTNIPPSASPSPTLSPLASSSSSSAFSAAASNELAQANNSFGLELMKLTCQHDLRLDEIERTGKGNVVVSPLSIGSALTMTALGASNQALLDARKVLRLHLLGDEDKLKEAWRQLIQRCGSKELGIEVTVANSIWPKDANAVLPHFVQAVQQNFGAEVFALSSAGAINNWCEDKTKGLIPQIIDQVPPNAIMYLVNAVYFKGKWQNPFDKGSTEPMEFKGVNEKVMMMVSTRSDWSYMESIIGEQNVQMIELPYEGSLFSMTIILPEEGANIDKMIGALDEEVWHREFHALHRSRPSEGTLWLPRLKLDFGVVDLGDYALKQQGLDSWFDENPPKPVLERMFDYDQVDNPFISRVLHKVVVELDEEGTVAAAVTAVECQTRTTCKRPGPPPFRMMCDRPFLFVIEEVASGMIWFVGKVTNPQPPQEE